jgi:lipopolysaccharide export system protein LptC
VIGRANALFPLALVIALAALSFWLERAVQVAGGPARDTTRHDPDFIAENFTATKMNALGRPDSTLTAKKMLHYPDDDSTDLDQPRLVQLREDAAPIRVRSERGMVNKDGDAVHFYDNVVVTRDATPERPELRVDTSYLYVLPNEGIARTPEPVLITEGTSRLAGIGMEVNNTTRQLALASSVRGTYVPAPAR